jgi:hypothetical protein
MFRFTIRDLLWLMAIAGLSCAIGIVEWAADTLEELAAVFLLFVALAIIYLLVTRLRWSRPT